MLGSHLQMPSGYPTRSKTSPAGARRMAVPSLTTDVDPNDSTNFGVVFCSAMAAPPLRHSPVSPSRAPLRAGRGGRAAEELRREADVVVELRGLVLVGGEDARPPDRAALVDEERGGARLAERVEAHRLVDAERLRRLP